MRIARKAIRNAQGQVTIVVGILLLTILFLLAFAINIGMLVHAKINLQNAADLAAYAGAAAQARQLNSISYLNYEMRRQYKKLIFRSHVLGNLAQPDFPRTPGPVAQHVFRPSSGATPYGGPTICVTFNPRDNFCQVETLRAIEIPTPNRIDSLTSVLAAQLQEIENARRISCQNIGRMNEQLALFWLYNTDPTLEMIAQQLQAGGGADPQLRGTLTTLRGLAQGLGIGPKLLMLRRRIRTLENYLNVEPLADIDFSAVEALRASPQAARQERTIQAYLSAYHTLGEHLFDADSIRMTELSATPQLRLEELRTSFAIYPVGMRFTNRRGGGGAGGGRGEVVGSAQEDCQQYPIPYGIQNLPVGVWKDPRYLTYYAVRLTARARLLFNPFGRDLELTAYAAAQPFGSRIGPVLEEGMVRYETNIATTQLSGGGDGAGGDRINQAYNAFTPGLAIAPGDPPLAWSYGSTLGALYQAMADAARPGQPISFQAMNRGMAVAMAPNAWELGRYNIPGDPADQDPFVQFFAPDTQRHTIWAPLFEADESQDTETLVQEILREVTNVIPQNMAGAQLATLQNALQTGFRQYMTQITQGNGGEFGENIKFYRMSSPFTLPGEPGQPPVPIQAPANLIVTDPAQTKSSWNAVRSRAYREYGRTGYSVKFVSFRSLLNPDGQSTVPGGSSWENRPIQDAQAEADYDHLKH